MSPANHSEHSRKHRQRTGPRKKGAGNFLPEILVPRAYNSDSEFQLARTEMSPAEHSRKHRQRTGPQKNGAGNLPVIPSQSSTTNTDSALQLAKTDMSPAIHSEHSWKHLG
jgi:hypothetical protein